MRYKYACIYSNKFSLGEKFSLLCSIVVNEKILCFAVWTRSRQNYCANTSSKYLYLSFFHSFFLSFSLSLSLSLSLYLSIFFLLYFFLWRKHVKSCLCWRYNKCRCRTIRTWVYGHFSNSAFCSRRETSRTSLLFNSCLLWEINIGEIRTREWNTQATGYGIGGVHRNSLKFD